MAIDSKKTSEENQNDLRIRTDCPTIDLIAGPDLQLSEDGKVTVICERNGMPLNIVNGVVEGIKYKKNGEELIKKITPENIKKLIQFLSEDHPDYEFNLVDDKDDGNPLIYARKKKPVKESTQETDQRHKTGMEKLIDKTRETVERDKTVVGKWTGDETIHRENSNKRINSTIEHTRAAINKAEQKNPEDMDPIEVTVEQTKKDTEDELSGYDRPTYAPSGIKLSDATQEKVAMDKLRETLGTSTIPAEGEEDKNEPTFMQELKTAVGEARQNGVERGRKVIDRVGEAGRERVEKAKKGTLKVPQKMVDLIFSTIEGKKPLTHEEQEQKDRKNKLKGKRLEGFKNISKKTILVVGTGAALGLGLGAYGTLKFIGGAWNLVKSEAGAIKRTGWPLVKDVAKTVAWHPIRGVGRVVATPLTRTVQGFKAGLNYPAKPSKSVGKGFFGKSWAGIKNLTKGAWYRTKQLGSIPAGLVMGGLGAVEGVADFAVKDVIGLNKGSANLISDAWNYGKSLGPNGKKPEIGKYALEAGLAGTVWDTLKFGKGIVWDGPKDWIKGPQKLDAEGKPVEAKAGEDGKPAEKTPGLIGKLMNIFGGKKEIGDVVRIKEVWDEIHKDGKPMTAEGLGKLTDAVVNYLNLEEKYGAIFAGTGFLVKTLAGRFLPKSIEKMDVKFEEFGKTVKGLKKEKVDSFVNGIDSGALNEYFKILTKEKLLERAMKKDETKALIKSKLKALLGDEEFFDGDSLKESLGVLKKKIGEAKDCEEKTNLLLLLQAVGTNLTDAKLAELFFDEKVAKTKIDYDNFGDNIYELIADKNVGRDGVLTAFSDQTFKHTFDDLLQPTTLADAVLSEKGKKGIRELLKGLFDLQETTKLDEAKLVSQGARLMEKFGARSEIENGTELARKYDMIEKLISDIITNVTPYVTELYAEELEFTWANFANEMDGLNRINREFYMRGIKSHPNKFRRNFGAIMKEENLQRLLTLGEDDRKAAQQSVRYLVGVPAGSVQLSEVVETIDEYLKKIGVPTDYPPDLQEACTLFRKNLTDIKECLSKGENLKNLFGNVLIQPMEIEYKDFGTTLRGLKRENLLPFLTGYNDGDFYERFNILMESEIPQAKKDEAKDRLFELLGVNDKNAQLTSSLVKRIIESMLAKFGNPTEIGSYEARTNHLQLSTALNAIKSNMTENRIASIYAKSAA